MKRGLALITITALLGVSTPLAYAATQSTSQSSSSTATSAVTAASSYTVKSGDTLWNISQSTGVSIANIENYNGITNANSLQIGQVLKIPATYTVKAGDSLWKISQVTGASVQSIVLTNGIANSSEIQVGEVLIIPQSALSTTVASTPTGAPALDSTYTVKSGDTLWQISQTYGVSVQAIQQANGLTNVDALSVGQVLKIPSTASSSTTSSTYTVQPGDTLWKIAQAKGVTVQALVQANQLTNENSLAVGQALVIPGSASTGNGTTVSSTTSIGASAGNSTGTTVSSVVVTTSGASAYNSSSSKVNQSVSLIVTVKDAKGNTMSVPLSQVTYTITGANPGTKPANASVNAATQQFTATQPGIYNCVATVNGVTSQPLSIQVFGEPTTLTVSVNPNLVTGSYTFVPVHFSVSDAMGQPMMWTPVTVTVDNPSIAGISTTSTGPITTLPSTVTVSSGGDGSGTVWLRAGSAEGTANVVVACAGLTKSVPIVSTSGPSKITATVANPTMVANTNFSDLVTVQAFNADGSPAVNVTLDTTYSNLFKTGFSTVTTNSQGVAQFNVTENSTSAGIGSVGARTTHAEGDVPLNVIPGADASQASAQLPGPLTVGQDYVVPITVKDASGNPVLHLNQNAFNLHLQGDNGVYNVHGDVSELGNGQYQLTCKPGNSSYGDTNMPSGSYQASVVVNGVTVRTENIALTSTTVPTPSAQPCTTPNITLSFPVKLLANSEGPSFHPMQIQVTDSSGKPVANQQVTLVTNNANVAAPSIATVTTDANGYAGVGMTPGFMPGTATITAMSGTTVQTIPVQTIPWPATVTLTAPTSNIVENGAGPTATVTVLNADGTPVSGVELEVSGSSGQSYVRPDQSLLVTNANGQASFTVPTADLGGSTLTMNASNNVLNSNTLSFQVVPGVDAQHSSVTNFPTTMTLGSSYTVSLHVADANGKPVTGLVPAAFKLHDKASGDITVSATSVSDLGDGNYSVTYNTSDFIVTGSQSVDVLVNGVQIQSLSVNAVSSTGA